MRSSQPRMKTIVPRHGGFDWLQGERASLLGTISQPDKGLRGQPLSTDARVKTRFPMGCAQYRVGLKVPPGRAKAAMRGACGIEEFAHFSDALLFSLASSSQAPMPAAASP